MEDWELNIGGEARRRYDEESYRLKFQSDDDDETTRELLPLASIEAYMTVILW